MTQFHVHVKHTSWFHKTVKHDQVLPATVLLINDDLVTPVLPLILQLQVVAPVVYCDITQGLLLGGVGIGRLFAMQGEGALQCFQGRNIR